MRNAYVAALHELARENPNILALVSDNGAIVYDDFRRDCPDQFLNVGIAEANLISVAAGLASCGKIPFAYTISAFLTIRAAEQVRNDICLQKMNVKLAGIGAGFVYSDLGPTHHATEDLAWMRTLPGMTVIAPADAAEARQATFAIAEHDGPVYLRLATGGTPVVYPEAPAFTIGCANTVRTGQHATIIACGRILHDVLAAADILAGEGISCRVIDMHTLAPLDDAAVLAAARDTGAIVTIEEHSIIGGLGSAVAEVLADNGCPARLRRLGLEHTFACGYGDYEFMKRRNGLAVDDIAAAVRELLEQNNAQPTQRGYALT